jgi:hypothetical protein
MSTSLPKTDLARFTTIDPTLLVQAYVLTSKQKLSLAKLEGNLKSLIGAEKVRNAIQELIANGSILKEGSTLKISREGANSVRKALGRDAEQSWEKLLAFRFPALTLGLDPDDPAIRRALKSRGAVQAAIVGVAYGLPRDSLRSPKVVRSELVWRVLRAALPEIIGSGPFPLLDKSSAIDTMILSGLAGVRAKTIDQATTALAAKILGVRGAKIENLRRQLIKNEGRWPEALPIADGFAERVKTVARSLSTPPFQGRVAIAQVYDAYGRTHPDAGSLDSFKQRLVQAAKVRVIELSRLDMPEHMSPELRTRSKTPWGSDEVHFVVTEWK